MKATSAPAAPAPRREDVGDLIVLHLYGSYREMGRQQVDLLGQTARDMYDMHRADWSQLLSGFGTMARVADTFLPRLWMRLGRGYDDSGFYDEIGGIGDGLRVSPAAAWRGVFGSLGGQTTTFAATRAATADGNAILAKNSDWPDRYGRRPQMVTHYHPDNGDLGHVVAGWPLTPLGAAGLNEAGLAYGLNFFNADQVLHIGLRPRWPYRRILQKATTVAEAVRLISESPNRGMSGFVSLADAGGDVALLECTAQACESVAVNGDWFAQSNFARTEKMVPHDRGRSLDAFTRRPAMEAAVGAALGTITPEVASAILRDRSNSPYVNESVVANASAFHSVIIHPASRALWHSTARQPQAPFGELAGFTPASDSPPPPALPADERFSSPEMEREHALISDVRHAMRLFDEGDVPEALAIWEGLADEPLLEPRRTRWACARAKWTLGEVEAALALLEGLEGDETPFDVRANALAARAQILDRLGRREEALAAYRTAGEYLEANAQYNDGLIAPLRGRIAAGLKSPQRGPMPPTPALQRSVPG
jgi:hypothetical protein